MAKGSSLSPFRRFVWTCVYLVGKVFFLLQVISFRRTFRNVANVFRAGVWSIWFKRVGKYTMIDSGFIIRHNARLVEIDDYSYIDTNVQFEVHKPLKIGKYVHICPNVYIQTGEEVRIEDYACLANGVKIYSKSNTYKGKKGEFISMSSNAPVESQRWYAGPVVIKKNAFIGINSIIMPGVTIGENAIVGAGSLVLEDVPANTIHVGVPAKHLKKRE